MLRAKVSETKPLVRNQVKTLSVSSRIKSPGVKSNSNRDYVDICSTNGSKVIELIAQGE